MTTKNCEIFKLPQIRARSYKRMRRAECDSIS